MHFSGWATLIGSGMLDVQHQRVDIPAHARCAHKGLLQKRLEEDLWIIIPHAPPPAPPSPTTSTVAKGLNYTELRLIRSPLREDSGIWSHCRHTFLYGAETWVLH